MDIDLIINQIRTYCPVFNHNVAGSADYATGLESTVNLPLPAAYVYPIADDPSDNENSGWALRQEIEERIAVVIQIDNTADRRGQVAASAVEGIKYLLFAAILNWNPSGMPRANQGLRYGGGHLIGFDRSRLFWQFEFVLKTTITEDDGFNYIGQPLEQINIAVTPTNIRSDGEPDVSVGVGITIPQ